MNNEKINTAIQAFNGVLPDSLKGVIVDGIIENNWYACDTLGLCIKTHYVGMACFAKYYEGEYYLIDVNASSKYFEKICTVDEFNQLVGAKNERG